MRISDGISDVCSSDRYSLYEDAIPTRAGPARILGLADRGHLVVGAGADITVYTEMDDKEAMFETPDYVFKDGRLVVRKGEVVAVVDGATHVARAAFDATVETSLRRHFGAYRTQRLDNYKISDGEIEDEGGSLVRPDSARRGGSISAAAHIWNHSH